MELRTYFRGIGSVLAVPLLLALLAGGATAAVLRNTPPRHEAGVVLTVPSSVAGGSSAGFIAQFVANYTQAIRSDEIVEEVSAEAAIPPSEMRDSLDARQLGNSNLIRVTFIGLDPQQAEHVAELSAKAAYERVVEVQLAGGAVASLREGVDSLEKQIETARKAADDYLMSNGLTFPREEYMLRAGELSRLRTELVQLRASGQSTTEIREAIDSLTAELSSLRTKIFEHESLMRSVSDLEANLAQTEGELRRRELSEGVGEPILNEDPTRLISSVRAIARGAGTAAAVAFVLGLTIVLAWRLLRGGEVLPSGTGAADPALEESRSSSPGKGRIWTSSG